MQHPVKEYEKKNNNIFKIYSKELEQYIELESNLLKPVVRSGDIGRFWATSNALVLFPYKKVNGKFQLITENEMKKEYPKIWNYLNMNKTLLSGREHGKFKDKGWFQLYPKNIDVWEQPKIMLPYMITRLSAYYDDTNMYFVNVTTGGFGLTIDEKYGSMKYFTGILNSKLLDWIMRKVSTNFHGGYFAANKQFLVQLPIHSIDFANTIEKNFHDKIVKLVEQMLDLHERFNRVKTDSEKMMLKRQTDATDKQIDQLVYELYSLNKKEIEIIEKGSKKFSF